jgi:hypothetical protein
VLDRGLFLRADLVISLAGIPLIGATLSVAIAGTETLVKYGVLTDWDESIRAERPGQREESVARRPSLAAASGGVGQGWPPPKIE